MTERVAAAEMGYFQRVHGETLREVVSTCEGTTTLAPEPCERLLRPPPKNPDGAL